MPKFIDKYCRKVLPLDSCDIVKSYEKNWYLHCFVTMNPFFTQQVICWHHAYKEHAHFDSSIHLQPRERMRYA